MHNTNTARVIAEVNLSAIVSNWRRLVALSGRAETAAVVKANAYGHGLAQVVASLYEAGCRVFFTASIDEAIEARTHAKTARIAYHDGLAPGDCEAIHAHRLTPTINDPTQLTYLANLAKLNANLNKKTRATNPPKILPEAMLHIDTGMNRLGVDWRWLAEAKHAESLAGEVRWQLVYSHLASADMPKSPQNQQQKQRFEVACTHLPSPLATTPKSLAASGGILLGEAYHYDLTRPGIALYGYPPVAARGFTPALTLKARVLQIRDLDPAASPKGAEDIALGDAVGYNATHPITQKTRLVTIAAGYADGVKRTLSNRGCVYIHDTPAPIVGRVSMDTLVVDISACPAKIR
ncbi:MAG: alanine racemase, partial [Proteobacteria bacterium]|nr:alanine racemase [Pseudomonadota bacterium]